MINDKTAKAPYNFIPVEDKIITTGEELIGHDCFLEDHISGKITYELVNQTEFFVGGNEETTQDNVQEFFGNATHYIIPGSTIRGLIRSNLEILSLSKLDMIEERRMLYRSFADQCAPFRKEYMKKMRGNNERIRQSFLQSIKAGYLYWKNEHTLVIVPAEEFKGRNRNFIKIHESDLRKDNILPDEKFYMYTIPIKKMNEITTYKHSDKYGKEREYRAKIKKFSKKTYMPYGNQPYQSGAQVVQFQYDERRITGYGYGNGKGYLFNSQWIDGKVNHYLVNALNREELKDSPKEKVISDKLVESYEKDLKRNAQQTKMLGDLEYFYNLPYQKKGGRLIGPKYAKLFFFRTDKNGEVTDFGPTPYFRTFNEHSVIEGIKQKDIEPATYDYASSLFGFVKEKKANEENIKDINHYEGRINFMNCVLPKTNDVEASDSKVVLMNPKPTAFQLYLEQEPTGDTNKLVTYNSDNFRLRGRKFYWKKSAVQKSMDIKNQKTASVIRPLKPNQVFRGELYFENLTEAELGLLLCAMQFKSGDTDMLGHGKPFGYGKIEFQNIQVLYDCKKDSFLSMDTRYYDAFVFETNSKRNYKVLEEYYEIELPKKIADAVYSCLKDSDGRLILDRDRLYQDIYQAIRKIGSEIIFSKELEENDVKEYCDNLEGFLKENLDEGLSKQDMYERMQELELDIESFMEAYTEEKTSKVVKELYDYKMTKKIEELKKIFLEKMKQTVSNYDKLSSIQIYKKVKSITSVEELGLKGEEFEYMKLEDFKKRQRLKSADEILGITIKEE